MRRKTALLVIGIYLVLMLGIVLALRQAEPGPEDQAILGVGIGSYQSKEGLVYLSGRRLNCTRIDAGGALASTCTIQIAGKTLSITAKRSTGLNSLMGTCQATYNGEEWPCEIGVRHVHVPWFAFINEPLGLTPAQMWGLRLRYPIENLGEGVFFYGILIVPLVTAVMVNLAELVLLASITRIRWGMVVATNLVAGATFFGTAFLWVLLTRNFWD